MLPAILGWVSKRSEWAHASLSRYLEASVLLAGLAVLGYFSFVSPSTIIAPVLIIMPFLLGRLCASEQPVSVLLRLLWPFWRSGAQSKHADPFRVGVG